MPFTPVHPLAVWPFLRFRNALRLDATCLVIGAMAPDFEYFIHGEQKGNFGHTLVGIFAWGIPATLLLGALFHSVVKWPLLVAAPRAIACRAGSAAARPWPGPLTIAVIASLVVSTTIGNVSHILWDSFTHADGWGVRQFPSLETIVTLPVFGVRVIYRVIQHGCSLLGLIAVPIWVAYIWRRQPKREIPATPRARARTWFAVSILIATVAMMLRVFWIVHATDPGSIVVSAISGILAGTVIASFALRAPAERLRDAIGRC